MDELLLEPLKYYEQVGREAHEKNTIEYFDNLLKELNEACLKYKENL